MTRWPVLTVSSTLLLFGCTPSLEVGLANAPRLGQMPSSEQVVHDAVSNGDDACGRFGEPGPLRARIPACFGERAPLKAQAVSVTPPSPPEKVVEPWLEHFYARFPCATAVPLDTTEALAWAEAPPLLCPASFPGLRDAR